MDVLLRRYAGKSPGSSATEHLDADELAAFAEGAIPDAARTRYVSHLVDCDNCRQLVSQLAVSGGTLLTAEATAAEASGSSWGKRLAGFLSPMTLRYAAFAMVLITVAGVVFLITRRSRQSDLVVQNEQSQSAPQSAVKPSGPSGDGTLPGDVNNNKASETRPMPLSQVSPMADQTAKPDQPRTEDSSAAPPKPAKEADVTTSPGLVASKKAETDPAPYYAPQPPAPAVSERSQIQSSQQQTQGGYASGPRKSGPADQFKVMDKAAPVREASKDNISSADDNSRLAANRAPANKRGSDEKVKGPRRDLESNSSISRNSDEGRARNSQGIVSLSPTTEAKPPETRSVGGRKFRREGNGWVDVKFKSSMPVKSISRGSSEFNELDSELRSIAQQLGGQVLVVRKNKAYLIK
jgi:hypothetical protein